MSGPTIQKLGIHMPHDIDRDKEPLDVIHDEVTGMYYELHDSTWGNDEAIVGAYHEDVGLVNWYRLPSMAEAREWLS